MSQSEEELEEEEEQIEEEFVDAQDSQYNPNTEPDNEDVGVQADLTVQEPVPYTAALVKAAPPNPPDSPGDQKWKKRVEQALFKMTAEVAALREQLEARRLFSYSRRYTIFRFIFRFLWGSLKHIAVDIIILGLILLWMRRKDDRRLEGAIRVLLGDAVTQVRGAQIGRLQLPGLKSKKLTPS